MTTCGCIINPSPPSPTKVMKEGGDTVSSEEFLQFLMNLPDSTHLVADPSKALNANKYQEPVRGKNRLKVTR